MEIWKNILIKTFFYEKVPKKLKLLGAILKYVKMPQKLYKYYSFDDKGYHLDSFKNNKIWLSNPENFNDPYDCLLSFTGEKLFNALIRTRENVVFELFENTNLKFTESEKNQIRKAKQPLKKIQEIIIKNELSREYEIIDEKLLNNIVYETDDSHIFEDLGSIINNIHYQGSTVIRCFSEINNSILMWSHYAENHKGFCLEYDFKTLGINHEINVNLFPVIYRPKLFNIDKHLFNNDNSLNYFSFILAAIHKSKEWEYEKEWRLIFPLKNAEQLYDVPYPTKVIAGAKITEQNKALIKDVSQENNLPFYQAVINNQNFQINFKKN